MKFWSDMFGRSLLLLVAAMVAALLGHICALPTEAESPGTTAGAEPHHADSAHVDAASCDATLCKTAPARPTSPDSAPSVPSASIAGLTSGSWRQAIARSAVASRRVPDRMLFLLNASFLI